MVFRQLLPLALLGTVRAQCNGHYVSMSEDLARTINPKNVGSPTYWSCTSNFALANSQDPVPFYYECENRTETLCLQTQVYARVPNMPAGSNSYGAFGVRRADHSELYMWGRKQDNIVNQGWEVVQMSKASKRGHSFEPRDVSQVTFSDPVAQRHKDGLLEIMFNLPGAISSYNFTAAVGQYGNHGHGRVPRGGRKPSTDHGTTATPIDAPLALTSAGQRGGSERHPVRSGETCGTNLLNCERSAKCVKNSDKSTCNGKNHEHKDNVCKCVTQQTNARETQTSTLVIIASSFAAVAGLIIVVGSIYIWKKNHA